MENSKKTTHNINGNKLCILKPSSMLTKFSIFWNFDRTINFFSGITLLELISRTIIPDIGSI